MFPGGRESDDANAIDQVECAVSEKRRIKYPPPRACETS